MQADGVERKDSTHHLTILLTDPTDEWDPLRRRPASYATSGRESHKKILLGVTEESGQWILQAVVERFRHDEVSMKGEGAFSLFLLEEGCIHSGQKRLLRTTVAYYHY